MIHSSCVDVCYARFATSHICPHLPTHSKRGKSAYLDLKRVETPPDRFILGEDHTHYRIQGIGLGASTWQVQERAVAVLATGRDVVVAAETGSGKTLAYLIPIISQLLAARPIPADTDSTEPDKRCAISYAIPYVFR